jgi:hypothetical protein
VNDYQNCQEPTPIQSTSSCFDSVSFQGAWNDGGIATADGNWNSKSYPLNQNELAYVYLTKTRNGHSDATLKTKYMFGVGTTIQDSIPSVCLAQADVKIRIGVKFTSLVNVWYWECFDGTSWNQFELHNSNRQSSDNNAYLWESCISFM